jgi:hypothetical protein
VFVLRDKNQLVVETGILEVLDERYDWKMFRKLQIKQTDKKLKVQKD